MDGYTVEHMIYPHITDRFALDRVTVDPYASFDKDDRFYGIYVMSGSGTLNGMHIKTCDHYFIPANCEKIKVTNNQKEPLKFIRCFGPEQ